MKRPDIEICRKDNGTKEIFVRSARLNLPLPIDFTCKWQERYRLIRDLESHLHGNGTRIIKFFLHLSKEEQRKRFLARIDEPDKNWKFNMGDMKERELWSDYMKACEACMSATSTCHAPWYVVPADDKENTRLIISLIILDTLQGLPMDYPKLSDEKQKELRSIRKLLAK